jgi:hypothetical protein
MSKFGAIKNVRQEASVLESTEIAGIAVEVKPQPTLVTRGRPAGKRSNPAFEPTTIFLRKATKKIANRTLEDRDDRQDLSELVEELLQGWISERA